MDKKTKAEVRIFGNDYTIVGSESEEYINKICFAVDKKMREIAQNPILKPIKISVLTAVNFCDEYYKTCALLDMANAELDKHKEEMAEMRNEINVLQEERKFLKEEINSLRKRG